MTKSNVFDVTVEGAAPSISIAASTTSLSSSGGTVNFTGSTDLPAGTTLEIQVTGGTSTMGYSGGVYGYSDPITISGGGGTTGIAGYVTVGSGGSISFSLNFTSNPSASTVTYGVYVEDTTTGTQSNTVTISIAPASKSITLTSQSATTLPSSGGSVTFSGTATGYNPGQVFYVFVNGVNTTTTTLGSDYTFSFTLNFPANDTTSPETYTIDVSDNTSNT